MRAVLVLVTLETGISFIFIILNIVVSFSIKPCWIDQCSTSEKTFCISRRVITFLTGLYTISSPMSLKFFVYLLLFCCCCCFIHFTTPSPRPAPALIALAVTGLGYIIRNRGSNISIHAEFYSFESKVFSSIATYRYTRRCIKFD